MKRRAHFYTQWPNAKWLSESSEQRSWKLRLRLMHGIAWPSYALGALLLVEFFFKD